MTSRVPKHSRVNTPPSPVHARTMRGNGARRAIMFRNAQAFAIAAQPQEGLLRGAGRPQVTVMSADSYDDFEYRPASEYTSEDRRRHYWAVAIGLQDVDGLKVSNYLRDQAHAYIRGEKGLDEVGELVRERYAGAEASGESKEADLVSQRIAELLTRGAFFLSPDMLTTIHAYLFQDLDPAVYHPGQFKSERLIKQEEILNGDSVLYADPLTYEMSLRGAFANEAAAAYTTFTDEELQRFCHTIAFLWQVHPFYEGNTRTIAVFSELYLNNLGFQVANDPFAKHARYFRDALVRAQYRNAAAKIFPDDSFLMRFYKNVIGEDGGELNRTEMICARLFEDPTLLRNVDPKDALRKAEGKAPRFD